jgi:mono/diheme cytochrome c family protein
MKPNGRIDEMLDQALRRLGTPSREDLEAARERIRQNVRSTNPADMAALPLLDTKPVSLWGLRQPLFIAGGVAIAFLGLSTTTFWIPSGRSPAAGVSNVALEPVRSGSAPPVNQADSAEAQSNEAPVTPGSGIDKPIPRAKAARKRPEPKRVVEEGKAPEATTVTGVPATAPAGGPAVHVQSDGDPARAVLDRVCTVCHGLNGIEKYSYSSPDAYKELVSDMISRGAVLSDEEIATIVEYLYKTYGQK